MRITRILKSLSEKTLYVPTKGAYTNKVYLVRIFVFLKKMSRFVMENGYIKLYRKIQDNELWHLEKFTKSQAWIDMILLANHKENIFFVRGNEIKVNRGQLAWAERTLAKRWHWSRKKVRNFLEWLKSRQQILIEKSNIISIVTIQNYNQYQDRVDHRRTTEEPQKNLNKNVKNVKKEDIYSPVTQDIVDIVAYLNLKARTSFKATTPKTQTLINARFKEGFTIDNFKFVIDRRVEDWLEDSKMSKFLRPETLFGTKFEGYLNEPLHPWENGYKEG